MPHQRPVGLFEGNTAHSSGYHWGEAAAVYAGGDLGYDEDNNKTLVYTITRHTFDPRCAEYSAPLHDHERQSVIAFVLNCSITSLSDLEDLRALALSRDVSNPDKEATNVLRRTKVWLGGASVSTYGDRFMVS